MCLILAVYFPNGTNSQSDRDAIQAEIDQLTTEIDRVAETTKFNETYLLKGDSNVDKKNIPAYVTTEKQDEVLEELNAGFSKTDDGKYISNTMTATGDKDGSKTYVVDPEDPDQWHEVVDAETAVKTAHKDAVPAGTAQLYNADGNPLTAAKAKEAIDAGATVYTDKAHTTALAAEDVDKYLTEKTVDGDLEFNLHVGADSEKDNKISVKISSMSSDAIGVGGLKVNTEDAATAAIDVIAEAIQKVSEQRSSLGAIQNRLEHTIANLDNVVENTTAAESRIRDTDMAKEMVNFSKNNILAQAGQSMLAQANQSNQGVLSLLQ